VKRHIIFIEWMIDYWHFLWNSGTASPSPFQLSDPPTFISSLTDMGYQLKSRLRTSILFLLQSKFSSTSVIFNKIFVLSGFCSYPMIFFVAVRRTQRRQYFPQDISWFCKIQTFPGPGKLIYYFSSSQWTSAVLTQYRFPFQNK